ncbi:MAG: cation diffusion facilitator family transporter [Lactobacillus helsingborgensis]|uniref:cation diffusion facilitator family transporter n=1 Tax=Lactobacillus helsingborgensis TaxID=1218494 RepID=UPI001CC77937|nr:cation diffusion facilitator family transporter [Lactobacillus helsingborgensis]MCT6828458.1 cation diffusion facilitator family transporter [Lactobacillus helsingborgensis]MCT6847790.1 cation diffusion facilitator family transporter [Lactobacillus helsingborgensis]
MKDHTTKRYAYVTVLNIIITVAEFIGGFVSGSLSLLSDAVHNLSDVGAIVISFIAHVISNRSRNKKKTFGYDRAETLAAFTNGIILILISIALFIEAIERFWQPTEISGGIMLVVSIIGLLANVVSMLVMRQSGQKNLNVRSTFVHMLSDALSSVAVVIGAIFIYYWHISWIDPLMTLLVSIFVFHEAFEITGKAANVLMESNPDIDLDEVNRIVLSFPEINNIHHVHVWRYSDRYVMLDAHVNVNPDLTAGKFEQLTQQISSKLKDLGINHINFQAECNRGKNDKMIVTDRSRE